MTEFKIYKYVPERMRMEINTMWRTKKRHFREGKEYLRISIGDRRYFDVCTNKMVLFFKFIFSHHYWNLYLNIYKFFGDHILKFTT